MFVPKMRILSAVLALSFLPVAVVGAGVADAQVRVVVPVPPIFVPQAEFRYDDDGYYRTHEGHYYHYDHDRSGWHYGRNHRDGVRWEKRHGH